MAKVLITPVASSGIEPFEVEGELTKERNSYESAVDGMTHYHTIYYINGASYPAEIVKVLEE